MINHKFIFFSAVQIYDISYLHFYYLATTHIAIFSRITFSFSLFFFNTQTDVPFKGLTLFYSNGKWE